MKIFGQEEDFTTIFWQLKS